MAKSQNDPNQVSDKHHLTSIYQQAQRNDWNFTIVTLIKSRSHQQLNYLMFLAGLE